MSLTLLKASVLGAFRIAMQDLSVANQFFCSLFYSMPPFLLYARTSKKRSNGLRLARLAVNLATLLEGEGITS